MNQKNETAKMNALTVYRRSMIVIALPFCMAFVFLRRCWRLMRILPLYVRADLAREVRSAKKIW